MSLDVRRECDVLDTLCRAGASPASLFRIVVIDGHWTGVGGSRTLTRLLNARLVAYRSRQFASDLDPLVEITDDGIEALRRYKRGESEHIARGWTR